jgi:hypothetical protein
LHGPLHLAEPDVIYDFDKFLVGIRNPELKGLFDLQEQDQAKKPHVFEVQYLVENGVRIPKVRSFIAASNAVQENMVRDWVEVFRRNVPLPSPSALTEMPFCEQFEKDRNELVKILRDHPLGSLGLTEEQISSYEHLELAAQQDLLPFFGMNNLPHCANLLSTNQQEQRQRDRRGRGGLTFGEEKSEDIFEDEVEEEQEENEEEEQDESDDDQEIVGLIEVSGRGRCHVLFRNGQEGVVHRDSIPEDLEGLYKELLDENRKKQKRAEKEVRTAVWFQKNNLAPSKRNAKK